MSAIPNTWIEKKKSIKEKAAAEKTKAIREPIIIRGAFSKTLRGVRK